MTRKYIEVDGQLVKVSMPDYREDATYANPDHPYGTAGRTRGHEDHWTDPNGADKT